MFASHVVDNEGRYRVTVVAYNGAMDPSLPVCSDGVYIDQTPPEVFGIHLKARTRIFLIFNNCVTNKTWERNGNGVSLIQSWLLCEQ